MLEMMNKLIIEYGPFVGSVIAFNAFLIWLYLQERKDRKEANKAQIRLNEKTNEVLNALNVTLTVLAERIK